MWLAARGCSLRRALSFSFAATCSLLCVATHAARADDTARIVLLSVPGNFPNAESVRTTLAEDLARVEVAVDIIQRVSLPASDSEWTTLAREQATERPGTLALFGWRCVPPDPCELFVSEVRGGAVALIPVKPIADAPSTDEQSVLAFALAATAREAVWGGLLLEMNRLVDEGARPETSPPSGQRLPEPHQGPVETGGLARAHRPWLWFEGGYHGEYPHPQGRSEHGPFFGLAFSPGKNIVPVLRVGWLGITEGDGTNGAIEAYSFPFELELRVAFPIGPAMFSLAPIVRLDLIVATANPEGPRKESSSVDTDLHVGGMTTWHTPLPGGRLEALVGVGVLATIIGNDLDIDGETMIPASKLRIVWSAGVAWSPL
jgi:hypothetical protein